VRRGCCRVPRRQREHAVVSGQRSGRRYHRRVWNRVRGSRDRVTRRQRRHVERPCRQGYSATRRLVSGCTGDGIRREGYRAGLCRDPVRDAQTTVGGAVVVGVGANLDIGRVGVLGVRRDRCVLRPHEEYDQVANLGGGWLVDGTRRNDGYCDTAYGRRSHSRLTPYATVH
jgi:hypothetical protein